MSYKTHKIALNPNNKQRAWFAQPCGYVRFAYNHALADFKSALENDIFLSASKLNERFNVAKQGMRGQNHKIKLQPIKVSRSCKKCVLLFSMDAVGTRV